MSTLELINSWSIIHGGSLSRNYDMFLEGQKCNGIELDLDFCYEMTPPVDGWRTTRVPLNLGTSTFENDDLVKVKNRYLWSQTMQTAILEREAEVTFFSIPDFFANANHDVCTMVYIAEHSLILYKDRVYLSQEQIDDIEEHENREYDSVKEGYQTVDHQCRLNYEHDRDIDERLYFTEVNAIGSRPALGVELEVYSETRMETLKAIRQVFKDEELILERDQSLDPRYGFEIVTRPFGLEEWQDFSKPFLAVLHDEQVVAYKEGYGIHVNIHRRHFTPLAEARIFMFLCAEENIEFVQAVAQRADVYHADRSICTFSKAKQKVKTCCNSTQPFEKLEFSSKGCSKLGLKIKGCGKYAPVNWKSDIAEFRIFQATTDKVAFFKNLEFVWALHRWTRIESATGSSWMYQDFLTWLYKVENCKDYPNLIKFLKNCP